MLSVTYRFSGQFVYFIFCASISLAMHSSISKYFESINLSHNQPFSQSVLFTINQSFSQSSLSYLGLTHFLLLSIIIIYRSVSVVGELSQLIAIRFVSRSKWQLRRGAVFLIRESWCRVCERTYQYRVSSPDPDHVAFCSRVVLPGGFDLGRQCCSVLPAAILQNRKFFN